MSVILAYVHPGTVTQMFADSLARSIAYDRTSHFITGALAIRFRPAGICDARNEGVRTFLDTEDEWLWFVDTDMGFAPDTLPRLLDAADPVERPVVGALCYGVEETELRDGLGGMETRTFPTMYRCDEDGSLVPMDGWFPEDTLIQVEATGAACLLIHRSALETVRDKLGPTWFYTIPAGDGEPIGEDLSFCLRLADVGLPVYVHTGIKTRHQKTQWVG